MEIRGDGRVKFWGSGRGVASAKERANEGPTPFLFLLDQKRATGDPQQNERAGPSGTATRRAAATTTTSDALATMRLGKRDGAE